MKDRCIVTPTVKVGNQDVISKLFTELANYTGSREAAQELWALSQVEEFREGLSNLEYDENGEPTFDSFARAINIKEYLDGDISLRGLKQDAGAVDSEGEVIEYEEAEQAIDNAVSFNEDHPKQVATVKRVNGKYIIDVEQKSNRNSEAPQALIFNNALNNKLLGILRGIGFDIKVDENSSYAGIFNPLDATTTAEGLRTIIQIAKGERGERAFPEEFAHAMIAGLRGNQLVVRLLNSLSPEVVEEVLGDQYEAYYNKYEGNEDKLKKEAAGKLLKRHIIGEETTPQQKSLLRRLWDWIKSKLGDVRESQITDAINEANREAGELAQFIMSEDLTEAIDSDLILNEEPLYDLEEEVTDMEQLASKALKVLSKRLKILSTRSKTGKYDKDELEAIMQLQNLINKKEYTTSCAAFLTESLGQIEDLHKELKKLKSIDTRSETNLSKIRRVSYVLRSIKEFSDAYEPIIKEMMSLPSMLESGEIEISEEDAEELADKATKAFRIINNINSNYRKLRFDTVYNFLKTYWGSDKKIDVGKNKFVVVQEKNAEGNVVEKKVDTITLGMIMQRAFKDINGVDRWISSLSDASDPMLSLVAKAVKAAHIRRDASLNKIAIGIRAAHRKLTAAGYTTEFMFEKDSTGKLTGMLISDINFMKFNEERNAFIKSLEEAGHSNYNIKSKVEAWERRHMELVKVKGSATGRTEMLPAKSMYGTNVLSTLSAAQREYYDTMMQAKALMEDQIPQRYTETYRAVQISKDMTEAVADNMGNPKKAIQLMLDRTKSKFLRRADDTGFGEEVKDDKSILLDFADNPIEKLPVYYTSPLENPEMLSTDFTASIMAYAGMAINYGEMNKVVDVLELTRDLIKDREVQQTSGDSRLIEAYKVLHRKFSNAYTKPGGKTNIGARIDDYYASVIYDKQKKDEGTILGTRLDTAKTLDSIKSYTGAVGLGLNLFSALSNVTVGKMQIFIEAVGGEYFSIRNSIKGKKNYYKDLPAYLAEINSTQKTSKMGLLIDKFDALEEFYNKLQHEGYYKGAMSRIIGRSNLFILNNMGEHYLHTRTMLAMLDAFRVKENGVEKSLYDVMDVVNKDGEYSIEIRDGVTKINEDGSESPITEDDLDRLKMRIGKVNQALNGAFNEDDIGAINRYALGRMAMQFRQWMPAHYYRRFARPYYDAALDQYREGYYLTIGRFALDTMKDLSRAKFQLATNWKNLSNHEKANIRRALSEISMFCMLSGLIALMGPEKDKKGVWYERMIIYQLKRMKLETGASTPITPDFLKNINTILQSPAASIKSFNNIAGLLEFWNMWNEIESGRYKGWSEYERNLSQLVPIYGQVRKTIDITDEDYMFTILNN